GRHGVLPLHSAPWQNEKKMERDFHPTSKAYVIPALTLLVLLALTLRLYYLQIIKGEHLGEVLIGTRIFRAPIVPPRGEITDRNGHVIATNRPELTVLVTPKVIREYPPAIARLSRLLGIPQDDLSQIIEENRLLRYAPFVLKGGISLQQAVQIEERKALLPGVSVQTQPIRFYPLGKDFAPVVGYVGGLNSNDVERLTSAGYDLPHFVGKTGVEAQYDLDLIGRFGYHRVERRGKTLVVRSTEPPQPGYRLQLTLDADLQSYAQSLLQDRRGAIVAIDPRNGEVLCLASTPTFDPNLFTKPLSKKDWARLVSHPGAPLHNRALSSAFAPGSTFKLVTLIAGVRAGLLSPSTTFTCEGAFQLGTRRVRCLGRHGRLDYERAIERSCNVFFANLAHRVGRERIVATAREFGFGDLTGIDLREEKTGTLPTDEWLEKSRRPWYPGNTVNLGIGQGEISATPLQMAHYISVIANRGIGYKPHVLLR
ncbi:MAG: penicillin-binding protein 2, partial [Fimbriimonadales bacterium]|nr:penicillin-binding protein 2 [Fimbriimonadales bacterium]